MSALYSHHKFPTFNPNWSQDISLTHKANLTNRRSRKIANPWHIENQEDVARPPLEEAAALIALAMGCVDSRSRAAARDSKSDWLTPDNRTGRMSVTSGRPTVRVPVLSNTMLSTLEAASRMSPPLISSPLRHHSLTPEALHRQCHAGVHHHQSERLPFRRTHGLIRPIRLLTQHCVQGGWTLMSGMYQDAVRSRGAPASTLGGAHQDSCWGSQA